MNITVILRRRPVLAIAVQVFVAVALFACSAPTPGTPAKPSPDLRPAAETDNSAESPDAGQGTGEAQRLQPKAVPLDLDGLAALSPANGQALTQLASLEPFFPPYTALSADGRVAALGNPWGVRLIEQASENLLSEISVQLPQCQFGAQRYLALSADGSFLALVTRDSLQVWQVGGGLLYEAPYSRRFSTDPDTCGMDMPQLAISPDGRLLAVSGMAYTRDSLTRFFRIIDILANESVYEWDGSRSNLHGSLDAVPGLGFSRDGRILQTFDALRFTLSDGSPGSAFRFWSTQDWEEIDSNDPTLVESYSAGDLLFALNTDEGLEVRVKTSGALAASLRQAPCSRFYPCQVRFSPNGAWAVLFSTLTPQQPYRVSLLAASVTIADLRRAQVLVGPSRLFRDLEGVLISDDGQVQLADAAPEAGIPGGAWWVSRERFDGLQTHINDQLSFTPQIFYLPGETFTDPSRPCPFCAACRLDLQSAVLDCQPGLISDQGYRFNLESAANSLTLHGAGGSLLGTLDLPNHLADAIPADFPAEPGGAGLTVRVLGYSESASTLFYCLELDQRPQGCYMQNIPSGQRTDQPDGFAFLRFSPDGRRAALFDERAYRLLLADMETGRLTERGAFQARAYPAPAHFYDDGKMLAYLIQGLDDRSVFWLELVDVPDNRSLGRIPLSEARLSDPVALSADPTQRLWALGESNGRALLLDFESGTPLYEWQAHTEGLIGLEFAADGRLLVTLGLDGLLRVWGVPK